MTNKIALAESDEEITKCFAVMAQLRPHLSNEKEFLDRVKRQKANDRYQLAYLDAENEIKVVAGFRISEWLAGGKYLEIEDFVSKEGERSRGFGGALFDWVAEYAAKENCEHIKLVSRVTRFDAHRFYLRKKMNIEAHYFTLELKK